MCSCSICFEELDHQKGNYINLKCKHEFHADCIFKLLITNTSYNNQCPMCRGKMIDTKRLIFYNRHTEFLVNKIIELTKKVSEANCLLTLCYWIIGILFGIVIIDAIIVSAFNKPLMYYYWNMFVSGYYCFEFIIDSLLVLLMESSMFIFLWVWPLIGTVLALGIFPLFC